MHHGNLAFAFSGRVVIESYNSFDRSQIIETNEQLHQVIIEESRNSNS